MKKLLGLLCLLFMLISCDENKVIDNESIVDNNFKIKLEEKVEENKKVEIEEQGEVVEIENLVEEKISSGGIIKVEEKNEVNNIYILTDEELINLNLGKVEFYRSRKCTPNFVECEDWDSNIIAKMNIIYNSIINNNNDGVNELYKNPDLISNLGMFLLLPRYYPDGFGKNKKSIKIPYFEKINNGIFFISEYGQGLPYYYEGNISLHFLTIRSDKVNIFTQQLNNVFKGFDNNIALGSKEYYVNEINVKKELIKELKNGITNEELENQINNFLSNFN